MAAVQSRRSRRLGRSWRLLRLSPLLELTYRARLISTILSLLTQIYLYYILWSALYRSTASSAGLDVHQAITYSTLAALQTRTRWSARRPSRESLRGRVRDGSIIYWFLRPVAPSRYYFWKALGEMAYGLGWILAGMLLGGAIGLVASPGSPQALAVFLVSLGLGQVLLYYLGACTELACFWVLTNEGVIRLYWFIQDLLSGAIVPLWFFPRWIRRAAEMLPFQASLNVPISLYVGRIPPEARARTLALQLLWCVLLAVLTRSIWRAAEQRVVVQGG